MRFTGQRRERLGDLADVSADVSGSRACVALASVAGVRARHGVPETTLDPREGCVPQLVGGDLLGRHPWKVTAQSEPQVVIATGGDGPPVAVAQQLLIVPAAARSGVLPQVGH